MSKMGSASLVSGIPHAGFSVQENDVVERIVEWAASTDAVVADKTAAALASIRKDVVSISQSSATTAQVLKTASTA